MRLLTMRSLFLLILSLTAMAGCNLTTVPEPVYLKVGVIADCQYADQQNQGQRHYRSCLGKLQGAVEDFNHHDLNHIVHLGDFIDKDYHSFLPLLDITRKAKAPFRHVLGNHDFSVSDKDKSKVTSALNLSQRYYSFVEGNWRFIVVDGNDVSTYGWPTDSPEYRRNTQLIARQYQGQEDWNGALSDTQLQWLKSELTQADQQVQNVIIYSHFPIYPENPHNLWNAEAVVALLERHKSVVAWMSGHNHEGNYGRKADIHYINFKGMLDTNNTAYATMSLGENHILIQGRGREANRKLNF